MVARTLIAFGVLIASAAAALRNYCITRVEQTGTYLCIPEDSEKLPDSTLAKKSSGGCAQKYLRSSKSIRVASSPETHETL